MKEKNLIDRLFKEKLYNYRAEHPEHVWDGIEKTLSDLEKTSSGTKWMLMGFWGAVVTLTIGGIFWYFSFGSPNPNLSPEDSSIALDKKTKQKASSSNSILSEKQMASDISTALSANVDEAMSTSSSDMKKDNSSIRSNHSVNRISKSENDLSSGKSKLVHTNQIDQTIEASNNSSNVSLKKNNTNDLPTKDTETYYYNESGKRIATSSSLHQDVSPNNDGINLLRSDFSILSSTPSKFISFRLPKSYYKGDPDDCMEMIEKPFRRQYIELLSGPVKANRLFYSTDSTLQNNVINRSQSEKVKNAYFIGLRYVWNLNRDVALKTGITFTKINEKMTYQDGFNVVVETNKAGDTVRITRDPRFKIKDNYYSFVDLPITLSYTWRKNKFFFDFNSGLNLNLYAHQTGFFYDLYNTDKTVTAFDASEVYPFKHFAGISLLMSGTIGYYLGYNTSMFFEPGVRYFTTTLSSKDYPIKQKYVNYRMSIGVRYQFTKK